MKFKSVLPWLVCALVLAACGMVFLFHAVDTIFVSSMDTAFAYGNKLAEEKRSFEDCQKIQKFFPGYPSRDQLRSACIQAYGFHTMDRKDTESSPAPDVPRGADGFPLVPDEIANRESTDGTMKGWKIHVRNTNLTAASMLYPVDWKSDGKDTLEYQADGEIYKMWFFVQLPHEDEMLAAKYDAHESMPLTINGLPFVRTVYKRGGKPVFLVYLQDYTEKNALWAFDGVAATIPSSGAEEYITLIDAAAGTLKVVAH